MGEKMLFVTNNQGKIKEIKTIAQNQLRVLKRQWQYMIQRPMKQKYLKEKLKPR